MKNKYLILGVFLLVASLQAKTQYMGETSLAYSSSQEAKSDGKILPTTPLNVIKVEGDRALVELTGWNKGDMGRILYFSKGERIISAAFSKKAKHERKVLETLTLGTSKEEWNKVSIKVWVENKNIIDDIDVLFESAKNLYQENCGLCHAHHDTKEFTANQWPSVIKAMFPRTPLTKEQGALVTQFVQKHAKK